MPTKRRRRPGTFIPRFRPPAQPATNHAGAAVAVAPVPDHANSPNRDTTFQPGQWVDFSNPNYERYFGESLGSRPFKIGDVRESSSALESGPNPHAHPKALWIGNVWVNGIYFTPLQSS